MPITIKIPSIPRPIYLNDSRKASKFILNSNIFTAFHYKKKLRIRPPAITEPI